ncbi:MAG: transposase [Deltaproteobacteria bacterium]|nr:transposase [Deltaproteobacteria bacterium]
MLRDQSHREGKPIRNTCIEEFNRTYREEICDLYLDRKLRKVRVLRSESADENNTDRSHKYRNDMTPYEYLRAFDRSSSSIFEWH